VEPVEQTEAGQFGEPMTGGGQAGEERGPELVGGQDSVLVEPVENGEIAGREMSERGQQAGCTR
jgi:hypothetical protein